MLKKEIQTILDGARTDGWVLEPNAKQILGISGIPIPRWHLARSAGEAAAFADDLGYPVVAKIVSPAVVHKTEVQGVVVGIQNAQALQTVFHRFARQKAFVGMLVEEMLSGLEVIIGGKIDTQFGPVLLLGMGGIGVEIYKDTTLRMAPIQEKDVISMVNCLTAGKLLHGFRGDAGIDMKALIELMIALSDLLMALDGQITSMDLNPVICSPSGCVVADARIILLSNGGKGPNIS